VSLPETVNLDCYHGDTWAQTFRLLDAGAPEDLTGATVASWARKSELVEPLAAYVTGPGEVTIAPPPAGLARGPWEYDLEITYPDQRVVTWVRGRLIVERDVTHGD
jgi:hypothetical protein